MSVYPNSVFPWTNRRNNLDVVWAADPNSLAAEISSIEQIIGTNPNIETSPPTGSSASYGTLSSRVSAANNNSELPYANLISAQFFINEGQQIMNSYNKGIDPYNIWNGVDGTIPCSGWWTISGEQKWNQQGNNFLGGNGQFLLLNGTVIEADLWNWNPQFGQLGADSFGVAVGVDAYNASFFTPDILLANGYTHIFWQGLLNEGDRIQCLSINATFCPGIAVTGCNLKFYCNRTVSGSFTSG